MEFKVGDKVKLVSDTTKYNTDISMGATGIFKGYYGKNEYVAVEWDNPTFRTHDCDGMCARNKGMWTKPENLELVGKKPKIPTHIVIWDEENKDPHRFFTSEKEARDFMKELSEKSNVVKDSVILVAIKSAQKVSITKLVRLKNYKI